MNADFPQNPLPTGNRRGFSGNGEKSAHPQTIKRDGPVEVVPVR